MTHFGRLVVVILAWSLALSPTMTVKAQDDAVGGVEVLLPSDTVTDSPAVPDLALPGAPPSEMWRALKEGRSGRSHPSDPQDGVLIRTNAEQWRYLAAGPLRAGGAWALLLLLVTLMALHVARGREPAPEWESGREVLRFSRPQRLSHWLVAVSFAVLSLTGLNLMYGRDVVAPLTGTEAFAVIALIGRYLHAVAGVAFAAGFLLVGLLWLGERAKGPPGRPPVTDGLMRPPPRAKYRLSQRIGLTFFLAAGLAMIVSGGCLLFLLTYRGPVPIQTVQLIHSLVGLIMIMFAAVHCYLTAVARERGAVAMIRGTVSEEWANRHFDRWLAAAAVPSGAAEDKREPARRTGALRAVAADRTPGSAT